MTKISSSFMASKQEICLRRPGRNDLAIMSIAVGNPPLTLLHPSEKERYLQLQTPARRNSFLLGRCAAKTALSGLTPHVAPAAINIAKGVFNFPVVYGIGMDNLQVSISHSPPFAIAIAFSEAHPLGIDIEKIKVANGDLLRRVMSPWEVDLTSQLGLDASIGNTVIWSAREALSKIIRTGLSAGFDLLRVQSMVYYEQALLLSFVNFPQYKAIVIIENSYVFSLVIPAGTGIDIVTWQKDVSAGAGLLLFY
ncbi:4'-phosphopantetheinyl transferase family protein [Chitinophaga rhizophila]|uniref:4'-phosphopantetheinyl transferase superfamily protein n=1 Tax=Chitinophaga rhizophila TaxID=2866212 RepID=A0ABS7G617_9BACT|nr:4'-phosphopantetheinyl transferase superfamily protein [Chitinophaga rhizophila]MBW8683049.1 4'-phosphopantetheinyl transferase superfamily protein [Chitinophaga rhizophila]